MRNKKNIYIIVGILLLFVVIVGGIKYFDVSLAFFNKQVYVPQFSRYECVPLEGVNMKNVDLGIIDNAGQFYPCTGYASNTYIPGGIGLQCEFSVDAESFVITSLSSGADCPLGVQENEIGEKCKVLSGTKSSSGVSTLYVSEGRQIYVNPATWFGLGKVRMYAKYPAYGLKYVGASNLGLPTTNACTIESLGNDYHTVNFGTDNFVAPNNPVSVVSRLQPAIDKQVITVEGINGGEPIYVINPREYWTLTTTDDGLLIVDTSQPVKKDSRIECVPPLLCDENAKKLVNLEEQSCDVYGGSVVGYAPVAGSNTKFCKYECSSGTLKETSDCVTLQECSADKPYFNYNTGKCEGLEYAPVEKKDYMLWIILGILALLIVVIIVIVVLLSKKKGTGFVF